MSHCKQCGSYAINPGMHGRDGSDVDLCDVCYWRKRSDELARLVKEHNADLVIECNRNRWDENKCLPYARIGKYKQCPDCKKDYLIDLPGWLK